MTSILGVAEVAIYVSDLERARHFYTSYLRDPDYDSLELIDAGHYPGI